MADRTFPSSMSGDGPVVLISVNLAHNAEVYVDTYDGAEPILAIDTGVSEIHISPPTVSVGPHDVAIADALVKASVAYRDAVADLARRVLAANGHAGSGVTAAA